MSKFKVGDLITRTREAQTDVPVGGTFRVIETDGSHFFAFIDKAGDRRVRSDYENFRLTGHGDSRLLRKAEREIVRKEMELQALKDRKAKRERAKTLRNLSPAGKRVVAMLQAGSAQDFGCQRENVIALVAAITGDKADDIKKALQ